MSLAREELIKHGKDKSDEQAEERPYRQPFVLPSLTGSDWWRSRQEEEIFFLCTLSPSADTGPWYPRLKRLFDIVVSGLTLVLLMPFLLLISLAIYLGDRGPVLYRQERIGQDGRRFAFYKFRSMVPNADALKRDIEQSNEQNGPTFKMKDDPRVTRVGRLLRRTSLDELPQFYNVLRGDMSLVGPRPHLPHEVERYLPHERMRLEVPPGLVCLREVCGRSQLDFQRWIELDLMYIHRRSLRTDWRILLRAARVVLCGEGAY